MTVAHTTMRKTPRTSSLSLISATRKRERSSQRANMNRTSATPILCDTYMHVCWTHTLQGKCEEVLEFMADTDLNQYLLVHIQHKPQKHRDIDPVV